MAGIDQRIADHAVSRQDLSPLLMVSGGWHLFVRLTPNAGKASIDGVEPDASGQQRLKIRVTAVPEKGKANKALISHLAKAWRLPKSSLNLASGDKDRHKKLFIADPDGALADRLAALLQELRNHD